MQKENGDEFEYKDRRQEIVFIGHGMKREVIQKILDECLLTDEEMALGPEMWKETMEEFDSIKLELESEECQDEECEDEDCDKEDEENKVNNEQIGAKDIEETSLKRKKQITSEEPDLSVGVKCKRD